MEKFDPIDIFFIALICGYFLTLFCVVISLIYTLFRNHFRNKKLALEELKPRVLEKVEEENPQKEVKKKIKTNKPIRAKEPKPEGSAILNFFKKKESSVNDNERVKLKKQDSKNKTTEKSSAKAKFKLENTAIMNFFKAKDKIEPKKSKIIKEKSSEPKSKLNLANSELIRKLFMKKVEPDKLLSKKDNALKPITLDKKLNEKPLVKEELNLLPDTNKNTPIIPNKEEIKTDNKETTKKEVSPKTKNGSTPPNKQAKKSNTNRKSNKKIQNKPQNKQLKASNNSNSKVNNNSKNTSKKKTSTKRPNNTTSKKKSNNTNKNNPNKKKTKTQNKNKNNNNKK